jgi:hypothetical protein
MRSRLQTQTKTTSIPPPSFTPVWSRFLERRATDRSEPSTVLPIVHEVPRSPGEPLDQATRTFMESRFGHDFSQVPVHTPAPVMVQPKLTIGQPGDRYEQEADRAADLVMRMPEPRVQRRVEPEEEEEPVQANTARGQIPQADRGLQAQIRSLRGGGRPLPPSVRSFFEPRFGHDFSRVRVHTSRQAADAARLVNAKAFTVGRDMVFGAGQYVPQTTAGLRLVTHELAHVVQQTRDSNGQIWGSSTHRTRRPDDTLQTGTYVPTSRSLSKGSSCIGSRWIHTSILQRSCRLPSPVRRSSALRPDTTLLFRPGVAHDHRPTGNWSAVQSDSRSRCSRQVRGLMERIRRGRRPGGSLSQMGIDCVCAISSPRETLEAARLGTMTGQGLTLASRHVDHYLGGTGADYTEDLYSVIVRDSGVRGKLTRAMNRRRRGHVRIAQGNYKVKDFQYAFGAIDRMDYRVDPTARQVHVWLMDRYEYHPVGFGYSRCPGDARRVTNCVHAAAVELKASGAADYWMIGETLIPLSLFRTSRAQSTPEPPLEPVW